MDQDAIVLPTHLFGNWLPSTVGEPTTFTSTMYFCPFSSHMLTTLRQREELKEIAHEPVRLAKRALMREAYATIGSLVFAIVNTDALRNMRSSRRLLERTLDNKKEHLPEYKLETVDSVLEQTRVFLDEFETLESHLATFPTNYDSSRRVSELCTAYDTLIRDTVIRELANYCGMPNSDRMGLYTRYGTNIAGEMRRTFDDVLHHLSVGHYGGSPKRVPSQAPNEDAWDRIELKIRTSSGVYFNLKPATDTATTALVYSVRQPLPLELRPVNLQVTAEREGAIIYGPMLRRAQATLQERFEYVSIRAAGSPTLMFCPRHDSLPGREPRQILQ